MRKVLTIAGSDSSAGAGLQADLKTFAAMKVYGLSVVTAATAQNLKAVKGIMAVPPDFVKAQLDAVFEDIEVDAVKIGMTGSAAIIETIRDTLRQYGANRVVVDPVMVATSGGALIDDSLDAMVRSFRDILLPAALVVTPNIPEAEMLTGRQIRSLAEMKAAAEELAGLGVPYVVVKGGHLHQEAEAVDIFFDGKGFLEFRTPRLNTPNTHGTGCTFASAVAAGLAQGRPVQDAVAEAKAFVTAALKTSFSISSYGGPVDHFGALYRRADGPERKRG